jgi:hypothetical protein
MPYARLRALARTLPFLLTVPGLAFGQPVQTPTRAEAMAALNPAPAVLTPSQLDQMLAPIALYPDQLLLEVLMASTFPQQVIDAGKWLQDASNAALSGDQLVAAVQPLPWDPSVKALIAFPQIVTMLNDHLDWTEALGTAFANQQVAVMARVQFLRQRAVKAGRLASTPHLRIENQQGEIIIEPEDPAMIYVPVYNPAEVYGQWPDSADPPIYLAPPRGFVEGAIGAGIGFSIGYAIAAPLWGWGHPDWRRHQVMVDPDRYRRITDSANIGRNQATIDHEVWRRTAPVVRVPDAQRPAPAAASAPHPPGTVSSTAVALPRPAPPASPPPTGAPPPAAPPHPTGVMPPAAPPQPAEVVHPPGAPPHPGEPSPQTAPPHPTGAMPPAAPPHPAEVVHPPGALPHPTGTAAPGAPPHPGEPSPPPAPPHPTGAMPPAAPPHPAEVVHPPGALPHPTGTAPPAAPPHPAEVVHSSGAPPHPTGAMPPAAPPHPAEVVHPPAAPPPQVVPPHPAAPPPQAAPHPAAPPPQAAPHPAAPPPQAAPPHPAAPPPQAAPHPATPPPAKNPPKPGEEEKH